MTMYWCPPAAPTSTFGSKMQVIISSKRSANPHACVAVAGRIADSGRLSEAPSATARVCTMRQTSTSWGYVPGTQCCITRPVGRPHRIDVTRPWPPPSADHERMWKGLGGWGAMLARGAARALEEATPNGRPVWSRSKPPTQRIPWSRAEIFFWEVAGRVRRPLCAESGPKWGREQSRCFGASPHCGGSAARGKALDTLRAPGLTQEGAVAPAVTGAAQ